MSRKLTILYLAALYGNYLGVQVLVDLQPLLREGILSDLDNMKTFCSKTQPDINKYLSYEVKLKYRSQKSGSPFSFKGLEKFQVRVPMGHSFRFISS